ncbi:hypothetical protein MJG53_014859 [Ovis ammon polii x Ovis aries]|uniref:Uncharacterized protein n=3 Tax=Ovis TaxID=9935 RepID=A0A836A1Y9_SHEEP|nr:hypothetical protein JEQ12_003302 [Ovis aries]KAI4533063.1 hypothetical protein MG293_016082 [Ovis ammon polii]KAI4555903.1 hypothetical protein MJT46_014526 [Ovis ammon polii x Ovis aries]KAI4566182.1 hypothetical protein MJG53_014859 [Ovis ammon polii x Ovis aries]
MTRWVRSRVEKVFECQSEEPGPCLMGDGRSLGKGSQMSEFLETQPRVWPQKTSSASFGENVGESSICSGEGCLGVLSDDEAAAASSWSSRSRMAWGNQRKGDGTETRQPRQQQQQQERQAQE